MDTRSNREKKIDAGVMARVKLGIALLKEKHGDDWVDHIDLEVLDLSDANRCVLGQVYVNATISNEQAKRYAEFVTEKNGYLPGQYTADDVLRGYNSRDGFTKGKIILDGPLFESEGDTEHGFDVLDETYDVLDAAWVSVIAPLQAARHVAVKTDD